jgi:hypothetical protein
VGPAGAARLDAPTVRLYHDDRVRSLRVVVRKKINNFGHSAGSAQVTKPVARRTIFAGMMAAHAIGRGAEPIRLRVSVESVPAHGRTVAAADLCGRVADESRGGIRTELFHRGQLYIVQTVVTAMEQNQVEMSIPGTLRLAGKAWRTRILGAIPNTTAWPSVALMANSSLREARVQTVLADRQPMWPDR